jgi:hypothetical protein
MNGYRSERNLKKMLETRRWRVLVLLAPALFALAGCEPTTDVTEDAEPAAETDGRLVLAVKSAQTAANGRNCNLDVTVRNDTGAAALNVQAAWMAQTDGFGIISDYQILGDFASGEARSVQLGVVGAPCDAVRDLMLTRAVCVVGPAEDPPQSCADQVMLDGGGLVTIRGE